MINECGQHMLCVAVKEEEGFCQCINGFTWDGSACTTGRAVPLVRIIEGKSI